jgi:hypothetical protein
MFREMKIPFVPAFIAGLLAPVLVCSLILTPAAPIDSLRQLEELGGDLIGNELHVQASVPADQRAYLLSLAAHAYSARPDFNPETPVVFAKHNSPRVRLATP